MKYVLWTVAWWVVILLLAVSAPLVAFVLPIVVGIPVYVLGLIGLWWWDMTTPQKLEEASTMGRTRVPHESRSTREQRPPGNGGSLIGRAGIGILGVLAIVFGVLWISLSVWISSLDGWTVHASAWLVGFGAVGLGVLLLGGWLLHRADR